MSKTIDLILSNPDGLDGFITDKLWYAQKHKEDKLLNLSSGYLDKGQTKATQILDSTREFIEQIGTTTLTNSIDAIYKQLGINQNTMALVNNITNTLSGNITKVQTIINIFPRSLTHTPSAKETFYANPFYVTRYMAPVYPVYLHNADGTYALDADGNKQYDTTSEYLENRNLPYEMTMDMDRVRRNVLDGLLYTKITLPYGFSFQLYIKLGLTIFTLIDDNFVVQVFSHIVQVYSCQSIGEGQLNPSSVFDSYNVQDTTQKANQQG